MTADSSHFPTRVDVVVIGAGQAALAAGYHLRQSGASFVLLERRARVGDAWRARYDSLTLFSPRHLSALPGLALAGDPEGLPTKDEVADYLEVYATHFRLPVQTNDGVARLSTRDGRFVVETTGGHPLEARSVIVASGAFQRTRVPACAEHLTPAVAQFTSETYRRPAQLPRGRVLVVGSGATGRQIARELAGDREVWLATGRPALVYPQRILGRDNLWWFDGLGILRADKETLPGRMARERDGFPGWHLRLPALRSRGVRVVPRARGVSDDHIGFADGSVEHFDAIVWATGYRDHAPWLQVAGAVDASGACVEDRGLSPVPGLFYVGRSWQNSRASALLCGVGDDAGKIVHRALRYLDSLTASKLLAVKHA